MRQPDTSTTGPRMLATALWLDSWLAGRESVDAVLDALHRLHPDARSDGLLATLRRTQARRALLLLPRPGRTLGWPHDVAGPTPAEPDASRARDLDPSSVGRPFEAPAKTTGAASGMPQPAVLLVTQEPVAMLTSSPTQWLIDELPPGTADAPLTVLAAHALSPRAAHRALSTALIATASELERLDLSRTGPRPAGGPWLSAVTDLPALDPSLRGVILTAAGIRDVLEVALVRDSAAVTAREHTDRTRSLQELVGDVDDILVGALAAPRE